MLWMISGEAGVVNDPVLQFTAAGKAYLRLRVVAKDRVRDSNGAYADGKPCFLDLTVWEKQAENLAESIVKGDNIIVTGHLEQREIASANEGTKSVYQIRVESIGVSTRWGSARTPKAVGSMTTAPVTQGPTEQIAAGFSEAPF